MCVKTAAELKSRSIGSSSNNNGSNNGSSNGSISISSNNDIDGINSKRCPKFEAKQSSSSSERA